MSDSLYMILYLVTEVLNYILAYIVFFNSTITKKKTSWLIGILLVLIFHFAMLNIFDVSTSSLLSFISMLVVPVLLLRPFDKRNIIIYPFIIISTSVIAISMTFLFSIIFNIKESNFIEKNILGIVCQIFPSFIAVIVMLMQKYKKIEKIEVSLSDECCDVIVGKEDVTDEKRAQIEDIIKRKTNIGASNIVISTMD